MKRFTQVFAFLLATASLMTFTPATWADDQSDADAAITQAIVDLGAAFENSIEPAGLIAAYKSKLDAFQAKDGEAQTAMGVGSADYTAWNSALASISGSRIVAQSYQTAGDSLISDGNTYLAAAELNYSNQLWTSAISTATDASGKCSSATYSYSLVASKLDSAPVTTATNLAKKYNIVIAVGVGIPGGM